MVKCVFCGREEEPFRGIHLVRNSGLIDFFCSSKCRKNSLKLRRDKRKLKWTEAYRIALEKSRKIQKKEEEKNEAKEKIGKEEKGKEKPEGKKKKTNTQVKGEKQDVS